MPVVSVRAAHTFHQFRVAVFAISAFLRLSWAFILALNAFSLTTIVDPTHQILTIVMFAVNATAFVCLLAVASFEAFKFRLASWTSRIGFELGWMSFFWVLETAGATVYTILRPTFSCRTISRINGDATGAIFALGSSLSPQRPTSLQEAKTCSLFNQMAFIGSWVAVGLSLAYLIYFLLLCFAARRHDRELWSKHIGHFDWSLTSQKVYPRSPELIHPSMIQRPHNPHLSKEWNDSDLSLPPVFINPFDLRKDSVDSYVWQDKEPQTHAIASFNRHEIMSYYQPQPALEPYTEKPFGSLPEGPRRHSILGLEGMDQPVISRHRSRPSLAINVPPQQPRTVVPVTDVDEDHEKIGRIMSMAITSPMSLMTPASEEPCAAIGRIMSTAVISPPVLETPAVSEETGAAIGRRMSMPFKSPISEESGSSHSTGGKTMNSSTNATAAHMANAYTASTTSHARTPERRTLRNLNAANGYPAIQQSVNRQSTMVKHDSLSIRRAMRYGQDGQPMFQFVPALPNPWDSNGRPHHRHTPNHSTSSAGSYDVNRYEYQQPIDASYQQMHRSRQPYPPQTWPQRAYTNDGQLSAFPMRVPPPPNHSPVMHSRSRTTSSSGRSFSGQDARMHSKSSSTPSFQQTIAPPMPALLDALSPVLRNSGNYQNFSYHSQRELPRSNAFGPARSIQSTPDSLRFEEMSIRIQDVLKDDEGSRRASKLRKSLPRIA
ncbi:hypothetical protein CPB86DRAFT_782400 [Serendipita vermifera]|nr:hypothetical protein CPB86DRAFT_782400 [Serendipita vermifera]